jgi:hypothetical protein
MLVYIFPEYSWREVSSFIQERIQIVIGSTADNVTITEEEIEELYTLLKEVVQKSQNPLEEWYGSETSTHEFFREDSKMMEKYTKELAQVELIVWWIIATRCLASNAQMTWLVQLER